jgi:hypothetical protein
MQPTPQQSNNEPTITAKIRVVDEKIRLLKDCGDTAHLTMLHEYRRFLEQQLKIYTDASCIPKTHTDTGCIPPRQ